MQKLFRFVVRWLYRVSLFFILIFAIGMLTDSEITIGIKTAAVLLVLLLFAIPERFPKVFPKTSAKAMTGMEFEQHCAKLLGRKGFHSVKVTPASGDYGADLVAVDKRGRKWVVQCKRYTGKVGSAAVQEIVAAKAHYQADKAAVMTNSQLTSNAKKLALENDVMLFELIDE